MVKKEALSSDMRFIKEVEELKIKQKLLIESLKRKNSDEQNKLFLEINSKLDFLVNIFNEANKPEDTNEGEEQNQFAPILDKIDELSENMNKRLSDIETKMSDTRTENDIKEKTKMAEPPAPKIEPKPPELKAPPLDAPAPDFKSELNSENEPKKKKKWF